MSLLKTDSVWVNGERLQPLQESSTFSAVTQPISIECDHGQRHDKKETKVGHEEDYDLGWRTEDGIEQTEAGRCLCTALPTGEGERERELERLCCG